MLPFFRGSCPLCRVLDVAISYFDTHIQRFQQRWCLMYSPVAKVFSETSFRFVLKRMYRLPLERTRGHGWWYTTCMCVRCKFSNRIERTTKIDGSSLFLRSFASQFEDIIFFFFSLYLVCDCVLWLRWRWWYVFNVNFEMETEKEGKKKIGIQKYHQEVISCVQKNAERTQPVRSRVANDEKKEGEISTEYLIKSNYGMWTAA